VNFISKSLSVILIIIVLWFLIFSTFFVDDSNKLEKLVFNNTQIWKYEFITNDKNKILLNKISEDITDKNILDQVTKTSRVFSKNWDYTKTNSWEILNINLNKWLFLFEINELEKNITINANWYKIDNLWIGTFFINLEDPKKVLIFSIDSILNLTLMKNNKEEVKKINLYPHYYILIDKKRLESITESSIDINSDALRMIKVLNIKYFNSKLIINNNIDKNIINLFSIKNNEHINFIKESLLYINNKYYSDIKQLDNFNIWFKSKYIDKYFITFKNNNKKEIFYKNLLLENIILLKNTKEIDTKLYIKIIDELTSLKEINIDIYNDIIDIIYYIYLDSFKINNYDIIISQNFWNLLWKILDINFSNKSNTIILKKIFNNYDYLIDNNVFNNLDIFIMNYLDEENINKYNIDYLLSFLWNIIITNTSNNTENLIKILWQYIAILIKNSDSIQINNIKTIIYNITQILDLTYITIYDRYFEVERDENNLLVLNTYTIDKNIFKILVNLKNQLENFIQPNLIKFNNDVNNNILIGEYKSIIKKYEEIILAFDDIEKYKSEYNKSYDIFNEDSIYNNLSENNLINTETKIRNYLSSFNKVDINLMIINPKNKLYCDNPDKENYNANEEIYCFEITDFKVSDNIKTNKKIDFFFFPYEHNTIKNIIIKKEWKEDKKIFLSYSLDDLKYELDEKIKTVSDIEEKYKFDFKNFFINNFNDIDNENNDDKNDDKINIDNSKDFLLLEDKNVQSFKRNKLLWEQWDFSILHWYLDLKYDQLEVTPSSDWNYIIKIINSIINANIKDWNKYSQYKIIINSNYIFSQLHSFEKISLKFINTNDTKKTSYLLSDKELLIDWEIKVTQLENIMNNLLLQFDDIDKIVKNFKYILGVDDLLIEYNITKSKIKFEKYINDKKLTIYLQSWKIVEIYYNWKTMINSTIRIDELQNILNTIK